MRLTATPRASASASVRLFVFGLGYVGQWVAEDALQRGCALPGPSNPHVPSTHRASSRERGRPTLRAQGT